MLNRKDICEVNHKIVCFIKAGNILFEYIVVFSVNEILSRLEKRPLLTLCKSTNKSLLSTFRKPTVKMIFCAELSSYHFGSINALCSVHKRFTLSMVQQHVTTNGVLLKSRLPRKRQWFERGQSGISMPTNSQ